MRTLQEQIQSFSQMEASGQSCEAEREKTSKTNRTRVKDKHLQPLRVLEKPLDDFVDLFRLHGGMFLVWSLCRSFVLCCFVFTWFQTALQKDAFRTRARSCQLDESIRVHTLLLRLRQRPSAAQTLFPVIRQQQDNEWSLQGFIFSLTAAENSSHFTGEAAESSTGFNSYTGNSAGVVGSGEVYKDPRDKWTKSQEQENSIPSGAPESLTFKERQRLFSQGKEVSNKVKASRKLMELENELNTK